MLVHRPNTVKKIHASSRFPFLLRKGTSSRSWIRLQVVVTHAAAGVGGQHALERLTGNARANLLGRISHQAITVADGRSGTGPVQYTGTREDRKKGAKRKSSGAAVTRSLVMLARAFVSCRRAVLDPCVATQPDRNRGARGSRPVRCQTVRLY